MSPFIDGLGWVWLGAGIVLLVACLVAGVLDWLQRPK